MESSIAHEIAGLFDKMHRLTSVFIFLRREQSVRKAYHLFTTLARDLADRYSSFEIALGKVVKDNTALRVGARDYNTLFESLILEPLKDLCIVGPILIVIDALDESGETTGRLGLHAFLAANLKRLPSNFCVVITSRPEQAIVSALARAPSVKIKYMDYTQLAAETHNDILAFFQEKLPSDELGGYVEALAVKAEGLFQWAAVASQLILDPPEHFDYSEETCIKHLLVLRNHATLHFLDHRVAPLDRLSPVHRSLPYNGCLNARPVSIKDPWTMFNGRWTLDCSCLMTVQLDGRPRSTILCAPLESVARIIDVLPCELVIHLFVAPTQPTCRCQFMNMVVA